MTDSVDLLEEKLVVVSQSLAVKGLSPATGGNFSVRINSESFSITSSGIDKSQLSRDQLVRCQVSDGEKVSGEGKPSAETLIHSTLYSLDPKIGSVLHTHSVPVTSLSRADDSASSLTVSGYEMQKAIRGNSTHEGELTVPVFQNSQDMTLLQAAIQERWEEVQNGFALILRGHGLYSWGADLEEAARHVEGYEFLFASEMNRRLLGT